MCALGVLLAGCAGKAPLVREPPRAVTEAPAPVAAAAEAPAPLPPKIVPPCAEDDLVGCTHGCGDGRREDCVTLGSMYMSGERVTVDHERALELYRGACNEGSARGCMRLADAHRDGLLSDEVEETSLYRRACDAGANLGCVAAGRAFLAGRGVSKDPVYAARLFAKVCERGNAHGCFELGRLYDAGEGVLRDPSRAFELFSKACKLGQDEGCLYASRTEEVLPPR